MKGDFYFLNVDFSFLNVDFPIYIFVPIVSQAFFLSCMLPLLFIWNKKPKKRVLFTENEKS